MAGTAIRASHAVRFADGDMHQRDLLGARSREA